MTDTLTIAIRSYEEGVDQFRCTFDNESCAWEDRLPAALLPFIAAELCDECEDLPHGLVGKIFELHR